MSIARGGSNPPLGTKGRRSQAVKARVCKTLIQRFESARRLHSIPLSCAFGGPRHWETRPDLSRWGVSKLQSVQNIDDLPVLEAMSQSR